jgi:hypothetical protein
MKITGTKRDDLSPPLGETTLAEPTAGGAIGQFLQRYGVIIAWVAIFGFFSAMRSSTFPRLSTLQLIFGTQSVILITAIGLVFSLAVGEYDLSVGSLVGLGSTLLAVLSGRHHWPVVAAIVVTLVICFLVGCVNALLSVYLGVQSIIITLGTGTLIAGLTLAVSGSVVVTGVPIGFTNLLTHQIIGLAMPFWLGLVLTIVTWFILQHMPLGRRMIFVQENREVARLAGLRVNRIRAGTQPGRRPAERCVVPTAGLRRRVPWFDRDRSRSLQRGGHLRRGVLPGHRHHWFGLSRLRRMAGAGLLRRIARSRCFTQPPSRTASGVSGVKQRGGVGREQSCYLTTPVVPKAVSTK